MKYDAFEMKDLAFGIGDTLYNMLCGECLDKLYDIGTKAVKASRFVIMINYDDNTECGDWMFTIDISNSTQSLYTLGFEFETLDEAISFLEGIELGATLKEKGLII